MLFKRKDIDATQGPILKNFIVYAIPIAIGSIIQTLFNAADMMVLGHFASSVAVASVGANANIISLLVNTAIGLSGGAQVVISHALGEKNEDKIQKTVGTSVILATVLGTILSLIGIFCSAWFLGITKCPEDCYRGAMLYLQIYMLSVPAILIYNYGAAIIRVSGDTTRPLAYLIASGILNVVLNFILCVCLTEKVAAVAIATFASQILGAILVVYRLFKMDNACRLSIKTLRFSTDVLKRIMGIGIPIALNTSLYSISNLQIQSAINSFGSNSTAGNTAAASIEGWVACFTGAISTTALNFMGQNIGARKPERFKKIFKLGLVLGFSVGLVFGLGFTAIGAPLLKLYVGDNMQAVEYGLIRMKFILAIYCVAGVNGILGSALHAFGYTFVSMANSIFSVLALRFFWMFVIYPRYENLYCLYFCFTVSWLLSLTVNIILTARIVPRKIKMLQAEKNTLKTLNNET